MFFHSHKFVHVCCGTSPSLTLLDGVPRVTIQPINNPTLTWKLVVAYPSSNGWFTVPFLSIPFCILSLASLPFNNGPMHNLPAIHIRYLSPGILLPYASFSWIRNTWNTISLSMFPTTYNLPFLQARSANWCLSTHLSVYAVCLISLTVNRLVCNKKTTCKHFRY